jgi:hypothetical protein
VLARDIYRDFVEEPGPTIEERLVFAGKHVGFVLAGVALIFGTLDFAGIHSFSLGSGHVVQLARGRVADLGSHVRSDPHPSAVAPSHDPIRVAVPQAALKREAQQFSVVDELAAVRSKDAVTTAMTTSTLAPPAKFEFASVEPAALVEKPAIEPQQAAAAALPITLSDDAARAQASVAPTEPLQLASLPMPGQVQQALQEPIDKPSLTPNSPAVDSSVAAAPVAIPLSKVPLPRAAPPMSPADRLNLKDKEYARAERCLANAIYFEARSEPIRGQMAVAQVVLNRVFSGFYPNDICGVVYQNANRHLACQFTFACDGKRKAITERGSWAVANRIARQTLDGQIYVPEVGKSTHYHAAYVHPYWAHEMKRLVRFGLHSFYRPYAWGNGADEPVWGTAADAARMRKTASR